MQLTWELRARDDQEVLATLSPEPILNPDGSHKAGAEVVLDLNGLWTASCPLSLEDDAVELIQATTTLLCVFADDWTTPLFIGRVLIPETLFSATQSQLTIKAVSPYHHLQNLLASVKDVVVDPLGGDPYDDIGGLEFLSTDMGQILMAMLDETAADGHGIVEGTIDTSSNLSLQYPPLKNVAQAFEEMVARDGSPDFELTPAEATDGTLAELNVFAPQQGSDKTATVILDLAEDAIRELKDTPDGGQIINRYTAVGVNAEGAPYPLPGYVAEHSASIAANGVYEQSDTYSEITDRATLGYFARSVVGAHAYPPKLVEVALPPEGSEGLPAFGRDSDGGDYFMGDVISVSAQTPGPLVERDGRVVGAKLTENEAGSVEVAPVLSPVGWSAGVSGTEVSIWPADEVNA